MGYETGKPAYLATREPDVLCQDANRMDAADHVEVWHAAGCRSARH
jgi:hypothetical protein